MPGRRRLPRSTPEQQGVSSRSLLALVDALERSTPELHSLMVLRHGAVVAEGWWSPYAADRVHRLFSLSKSFTSAAVGLARAEGLLALDDRVVDHLSDDAPEQLGARVDQMRIRDLLTMTAGHEADPSDRIFAGTDWVRTFLSIPAEHEPGTHFTYNTAATYVLSAIVQKVTGQRLLDYLRPRLLAPLGITGATWERSPEGIDTGGFGLSVTTEDVACFGRLLIDDGVWDGTRLLPEGWVAEATARQVPNGDDPANEWAQGYGYQFWRCTHGAYRADGAFGQYCVVMPEQGVVVAITSSVTDMGAVLSLLWQRLLPGLTTGAAAPDRAGHDALTRRLAGLRLDPPAGDVTPNPAGHVTGRVARFEANPLGIDTAVLDLGADHDVVTVTAGRRTHRFDAGHGRWLPGSVRVRRHTTDRVLASGVWVEGGTYLLMVRESNGPMVLTVRAAFGDGDDVTVEPSFHVSFGPTTFPALTARLEPSARGH